MKYLGYLLFISFWFYSCLGDDKLIITGFDIPQYTRYKDMNLSRLKIGDKYMYKMYNHQEFTGDTVIIEVIDRDNDTITIKENYKHTHSTYKDYYRNLNDTFFISKWKILTNKVEIQRVNREWPYSLFQLAPEKNLPLNHDRGLEYYSDNEKLCNPTGICVPFHGLKMKYKSGFATAIGDFPISPRDTMVVSYVDYGTATDGPGIQTVYNIESGLFQSEMYLALDGTYGWIRVKDTY